MQDFQLFYLGLFKLLFLLHQRRIFYYFCFRQFMNCFLFLNSSFMNYLWGYQLIKKMKQSSDYDVERDNYMNCLTHKLYS